ncbi:hypothetical protein EJ05DRAFT_274469 [Pseudovirgaria hyperparasitica]|uniref:Tse2 ADP-ribosyltransferase toxin domain-containing protein n=1 Tax=Pseudovirgaria hyperparasitica TaxID=470096 RepID=A0A6A6WBF2_9PEZI|nr:uncharacterized protein EJ05DRAFT_274469 [Pseudovirgaria hyperparasitica]KAF2760178.1 hypothetical protein EJ05DRAFT_274469 [Pseudovirgaria hyperparasitica]
MAPSLINVFRTVPKELFRVNYGLAIRLREWSLQRQRSYDILTDSGRVKAKALDPHNYKPPNGASMRPMGFYQKKLVAQLRGESGVIYCIPADLILVHEHTDHYSLQAATEMSLEQLNTKITSFLASSGTIMDKKQWLQEYTGTGRS